MIVIIVIQCVLCRSHFEQYERRADVVQDVEVFCSTGTVQRSPVCREDELQETSTSSFISPLKTQITFKIYIHFKPDEGSVASLRNTLIMSRLCEPDGSAEEV